MGRDAKKPWLAVAITVLVAACLGIVGNELDQKRQREIDERVAIQARVAVESRVGAATDGLRILASAIEASDEDPAAFQRSATALLSNPGLSSVSFANRRGGTQRITQTATLGRDGRVSGLGTDMGSDPAQAEALERAAATGKPTITEPFELREGGPSAAIIFAPVYRARGVPEAAGDGPRTPRGFAIGVYDLTVLAGGVGAALPGGTEFRVEDGETLVAGAPGLQDASATGVSVAGRAWRVEVKALDRAALPLAVILPGLGCLVAGMVIGVVSSARRRERYAQAVVAERLAERDHAEAERERAQQEFAATFDESPIGIAIVGLDGYFLSANRSLCGLLGLSADELRVTRVTDLTHPDEDADEGEAARGMIDGTLRHYRAEKRYGMVNGQILWLALNAVLIRDSEGKPLHFLAHVEDVTERRRMQERLQELADHDDLTGLLNRRGFGRELQRKLFECERYGPSGALLVMDIDGLKRINDTFGHASGDVTLMAAAGALQDGSRKSDVVARVGGDEFAVILPQGESLEARQAAELLLARLGRERSPGDEQPLSASFGVVVFADLEVFTQESAVNAADLAMYEAKRAGGRRLALWSG